MHHTVLAVLMLASIDVNAELEIHRCVQDDGTIAFQEMPCPKPESADDAGTGGADRDSDRDDSAPADDSFDFVNPFDAPEGAPVASDTELPESLSQDRAKCEKTTRDAIDAIDLEMRKGYTKEQGDQYLAELLTLTRQLRACKTL